MLCGCWFCLREHGRTRLLEHLELVKFTISDAMSTSWMREFAAAVRFSS